MNISGTKWMDISGRRMMAKYISGTKWMNISGTKWMDISGRRMMATSRRRMTTTSVDISGEKIYIRNKMDEYIRDKMDGYIREKNDTK